MVHLRDGHFSWVLSQLDFSTLQIHHQVAMMCNSKLGEGDTVPAQHVDANIELTSPLYAWLFFLVLHQNKVSIVLIMLYFFPSLDCFGWQITQHLTVSSILLIEDDQSDSTRPEQHHLDALSVVHHHRSLILAMYQQLYYNIALLSEQNRLIAIVMGNQMAEQQVSQFLLNINVAMLIGCDIASILLFVKLSRQLAVVENSPILTAAEAMQQRDTHVMFKTRAVLSEAQAIARIQLPISTRDEYRESRSKQRQLTYGILRRHLSEKQADLYYSASRSFKKQAQLNRFSLFRLVLADCNIPRMYPSHKNTANANKSSSMFLSHNMVSLGKINKRGEIQALCTAFNRSFIKKLLGRQREIVMFQFIMIWAIYLLHIDQLSNWYNYAKKQTMHLYRYLFSQRKKRRVEVDRDATCIICYVRPRNVILRECKHFLVCDDCLSDVDNKLLGCPICRKQSSGKIRVVFQA